MTERELNEARELKERIRELERHISTLRLSAADITPKLDGMPRATDIKSKVEKLAAHIVDAEQELESIRAEFCAAAITITTRIQNADLNRKEKTLLILHYCACMNFRDISFQMGLSDATTFRLHRDGLKKMIVDDSCKEPRPPVSSSQVKSNQGLTCAASKTLTRAKTPQRSSPPIP